MGSCPSEHLPLAHTDIPQGPKSNPLRKNVLLFVEDTHTLGRGMRGGSTEPDEGVLVILREDHHGSDPSPEAK